MEVEVRKAEPTGKVWAVEISGRIDSYTSPKVEEELDALLSTSQYSIIVGFEEVNYISSSGLSVLLEALKRARKHEGDLKLAGLQPNVAKVFKVAGFTKIFNIYTTQAEALSSFGFTPEEKATLTIREGPQAVGTQWVLNKETTFRLGRDDANEIVLPSEFMSGKNAEIKWDGSRYVIQDVKSTNKTYVNGEAIDRKVLSNGDKIEIGDYVLVFKEYRPE